MEKIKKDETAMTAAAGVLLFLGIILFLIGVAIDSFVLIVISFFFDIAAVAANRSSSSSSSTTAASTSSTSTSTSTSKSTKNSSTSSSLSEKNMDLETLGLSQEKKKECPYCSHEMKEDEKTCPNCGQKIFEKDEGIKIESEGESREKTDERTRCLSNSSGGSEATEKREKVRCLECGVVNDEENNFCIHCGSELEK